MRCTRTFRAVSARFQSAGRVCIRSKENTRAASTSRVCIPFLFLFTLILSFFSCLSPPASRSPSPPLLSTPSFPRRRRDRPPAWKNTRGSARTPGKQSRDRDVNSRMSCTRSREQNMRYAFAFIVHMYRVTCAYAKDRRRIILVCGCLTSAGKFKVRVPFSSFAPSQRRDNRHSAGERMRGTATYALLRRVVGLSCARAALLIYPLLLR